MPRTPADGADSLSQMLGEMDTSQQTSSGGGLMNELYTVHQSETTLILRCANRGMKVLVNMNYGQDKILSILDHERRVSNYLPPNCAHRKVHHLDTYKGCFGFNFDWVEGITLKAWLASLEHQKTAQDESGGGDLMTRLHVAKGIAKAVSNFHEAGVAHANIAPANIILSFKSKTHCDVTLIDLSKAEILSDEHISKSKDAQEAYSARMKLNDMKALGLVLYSVLGGKDDSVAAAEDKDAPAVKDDEETDQSRSKKGRNAKQPVTNNMPFYLVSLVSSLIAPSINERGEIKYQYKSAKDVFNDLQEADKKPEVYLKPNLASEMATRTLRTPTDSFYGRLSEVSMVQQSLSIVMKSRGQPVVVSVSGHAGDGKTTLLRQIFKPIAASNGFVIRCNFDRIASPDTVLVDAFNVFFGNLLDSDNQSAKESIKSNIHETLGLHVDALEESIPNLCAFMDDDLSSVTSHQSIKSFNANNLTQQLKFLLSKLVYAISRESHPIAILFEDLHWADRDALDTLQTMMVDKNIAYCLYFVSFRDNNAAITGDITRMIETVQAHGLQLFNIRLGPIDKETVNTLVSETLIMPPSLSQPLSSLIHSKTGGVILFVTNFLKSLHEKGLVRYSLATCRWTFDYYTIRDEKIPSDIVKHLAERISRLPQSVQTRLQIASCLGSTFELETFKRTQSNLLEIDDFISTVTEGGFIHPNFPAAGQYTWAHDQIKLAAYSLIPSNAREKTHLLIGTRMFMNTSTSQVHCIVHDIVRNMNLGTRLLSNQEQKEQLARLNLLAGEKSTRQSAFHSAENYFQAGIALLDHDWITNTYNLAMKLFNSALQAASVTGNAFNFNATINKPLMGAKCPEDRLPAHYSQVRFLAVSGNEKEAFEYCLRVLGEFGQVIPHEPTPKLIYMEVVKTKALLNNYSRDDFLRLPRLDKFSTKYWQIKMWKMAMILSFHLNLNVAPLIGAKIIQLSAESGWCEHSAIGLYSFGHALITMMQNIEEGYIWSKIAIELVEQFKYTGTHIAVLKTLHYGFVSFWKEPIQAVTAILVDTHQDALMEGQTEFAISSAMQSCRQEFMSGQNLVKANENCISLSKKMAEQKQFWGPMLFASHHKALLRLIGAGDCNVAFATLPENINDEDELLQAATEREQNNLVHVICFYRMLTAFWFRQYDEAACYRSRRVIGLLDIFRVFVEGLTALQLARRRDEDEDKWTQIAEKAVTSFQTWQGYCAWNFSNKAALLEAELYFLREEFDKAEDKYNTSIELAYKHHFLHEEGLAMELAGKFYIEMGNNRTAKTSLMTARACYVRWGADALVPALDATIDSL